MGELAVGVPLPGPNPSRPEALGQWLLSVSNWDPQRRRDFDRDPSFVPL